jgi:hypothetical protein
MTFENQKRQFALAVTLLAFISASLLARSGDDHDEKAKEAASQSAKAAKVFDAIMKTPDKAIPRDLLERESNCCVPTGHQGCLLHRLRGRTRGCEPAHE